MASYPQYIQFRTPNNKVNNISQNDEFAESPRSMSLITTKTKIRKSRRAEAIRNSMDFEEGSKVSVHASLSFAERLVSIPFTRKAQIT